MSVHFVENTYNKLASSVDAIAISEIWNYHPLSHLKEKYLALLKFSTINALFLLQKNILILWAQCLQLNFFLILSSSITITAGVHAVDLEKCFPNILRLGTAHDYFPNGFSTCETFKRNQQAIFDLSILHITARFDLWQSHIVKLDPTSTLKQLRSLGRSRASSPNLGPGHTFRISNWGKQRRQI